MKTSTKLHANRHATLAIRSASSATTPQSSACPSGYPTEDEDEIRGKKRQPFAFLSLPSELRNKIYAIMFEKVPAIIDLDPEIFHFLRQRLPLFFVCRQFHDEVSHCFYATRTFRVFAVYGRYFKTNRPLLARLADHHRASITSLQLRLGPGWNSPPKGWAVNDALGLKDCTNVRVLKVFVELDPGHAIFKGFRNGDGFYEKFSQGLLQSILEEIPSIQIVEFDAWSSVTRDGGMMTGLLETAVMNDKIITWGPEREWEKDDERDKISSRPVVISDAVLLASRPLAVLA